MRWAGGVAPGGSGYARSYSVDSARSACVIPRFCIRWIGCNGPDSGCVEMHLVGEVEDL